MLSKSQARLFFLGGTFVTFAIFIGLTIYSLTDPKFKEQDARITEEVVRGKEIWEKNNCMGCHTILGEGAYYAPELTKVIERRGEEYVKTVLTFKGDAWAPNGRKMVAYGMSEQEANDMIAFFKWIGSLDLNGFDRVVSPIAKKRLQSQKQ